MAVTGLFFIILKAEIGIQQIGGHENENQKVSQPRYYQTDDWRLRNCKARECGQQFGNQETPADLMTNDSRVRIVDGKPVVEQIRILRLRATTPIDREQRVPPIVSIRSTMEPIIVRNVYPDASKPVVNLESTDPKIQASPVFDEDRLETSIQGLSSRAEVESTKSETIDR